MMNNANEQKLEHIISRMQADRSIDAPTDSLKYAKDLFRTRAAEPSLIQRIVAVLRVDLAPNRAALGERSASGGQARQMLFDSGENAIDLRVTATESGFGIRGQILGGGFELGEVQIGGQFTEIDEIGGFRFASVVAGEYTMVVRSESRELTIEGLILK